MYKRTDEQRARRNAYMRDWRAKNPERVRATRERYYIRKAAQLNARGGVSMTQIDDCKRRALASVMNAMRAQQTHVPDDKRQMYTAAADKAQRLMDAVKDGDEYNA